MPPSAGDAAAPDTAAPDSAATGEMVRRLRGGTDLLTAAALRRLDAEPTWYRALPAEDRSWIGLVAQSGIASFIAWYENQGRGAYNAGEIFRAAPPELTRSEERRVGQEWRGGGSMLEE